MKRVMVAIGFLALAVARSQGGILFDQTTVEVKLEKGALVVDVPFVFRNDGKDSLVIERVETTCGCQKVELKKQDYAPGEKGSFVVKVHAGLYTAKVVKTVKVHGFTADGGEWKPIELTMSVDVPQVLTVKPNSIIWEMGDPASEQTVDVAATDGNTVRVTHVETTSSIVKGKVEEVQAGKHYKIHLKPEATDLGHSGKLIIHTDSKIPGWNTYVCHYVVRQKVE